MEENQTEPDKQDKQPINWFAVFKIISAFSSGIIAGLLINIFIIQAEPYVCEEPCIDDAIILPAETSYCNSSGCYPSKQDSYNCHGNYQDDGSLKFTCEIKVKPK